MQTGSLGSRAADTLDTRLGRLYRGCGASTVAAISVFPNLKGFVGFDFIEYKGELFLIEINSRYTTSMSLIEKCKRKSSLDYIYNRFNNIAGKTCRLELI